MSEDENMLNNYIPSIKSEEGMKILLDELFLKGESFF